MEAPSGSDDTRETDRQPRVRKIAVRNLPPGWAPRSGPAMRPESTRTGREDALAGGEGPLTAIKGLGPAKAEALLTRFGTLEAIRDAEVTDLTEVRGVGPALARSIKDALG